MDIVFIITGVFILLTGISIKQFGLYDLIAGYNTMSAQEKANFNIERFVTLMRNVFLIMGILIIAGSLVNIFLKTDFISLIIFIASMVLGLSYLLIQGQRLKKEATEKNKCIPAKL